MGSFGDVCFGIEIALFLSMADCENRNTLVMSPDYVSPIVYSIMRGPPAPRKRSGISSEMRPC